MADFVFRIASNIILGSYTISRLGQFAKEYGTKFMVILDPMLREVGVADKALQSLDDHKIDYFTFEELSDGASTKTIESALTLAREAHIHGVIAVGGAKTLNIAKVVSSVYYELHSLYDFVDGSVPSVGTLPCIAVPTTMRDAFIFSNRAPIIDSRKNNAVLLTLQNGICKLALFDPNFSVTLTENQTTSMSIESICLAVETYISQKATFFSDMIVEKAVELIGYALDGNPSPVVTTPSELLLTQGGCMTSLAAAMSSPGVASILAMTINARYKISRSLLASIFCPYVIDDAAKFKSDKIAKLAKLFRIAPADTNNEKACEMFSENIRQRLAKANLPARLKDLSVSIEQLALSTEDASNLDLMSSLPRSMSSDELFDFVKLAF